MGTEGSHTWWQQFDCLKSEFVRHREIVHEQINYPFRSTGRIKKQQYPFLPQPTSDLSGHFVGSVPELGWSRVMFGGGGGRGVEQPCPTPGGGRHLQWSGVGEEGLAHFPYLSGARSNE